MARPTEGPESESTLPQPELNPLLNPVLGQHMGRWAEVYFTSPPEKREEAVLELLHELRSDAQPETEAAYHNEVLAGNPVHEILESIAARPQHEELLCPACGQRSPANQIFCGACGAPIQVGISRAGLRREAWPIREPIATDSGSVNTSEVAAAPAEYSEVETSSIPLQPQSDVYDYPRRPSWSWEEEARQHERREKRIARRNRISMFAALMILAGGLIYVLWRNNQSVAGTTHALPQTAPQAAPLSVSPNVPTPAAAAKPIPVAKGPDHNAESSRIPSESVASAPTKSVSPAPTPAPASDASATDELAIAQEYLNATNGKARDSSEAAKWLWKSVGKQNATATLLLSDLYLRGDGVTKSCDQGRLLLDAAARKKVPGAAERIRNIQAFGCQ